MLPKKEGHRGDKKSHVAQNNGAFLSTQPASKTALLPEWHAPPSVQYYQQKSARARSFIACAADRTAPHSLWWHLPETFNQLQFESTFSLKVYALTSSPLASRWVSSFRLRIILSSLKSYGKVSVHSVSSWRTLGVIFRTLIWKLWNELLSTEQTMMTAKPRMFKRRFWIEGYYLLSIPCQLGDRWVAVAPCTSDTLLTWVHMGVWRGESWAGRWRCTSSVETYKKANHGDKQLIHVEKGLNHTKTKVLAERDTSTLQNISRSEKSELKLLNPWCEKSKRTCKVERRRQKPQRKKKVTLALSRFSKHQRFSERTNRKDLLTLVKLQSKRNHPGWFRGKNTHVNTHIWIIVHSRDQVVNEGLQGPRNQVVVMIEEAGVALLFGLVQVVAAGVQLPRERWCLRHVVLQRQGGQTQSAKSTSSLTDISPQMLMQDGRAGPK